MNVDKWTRCDQFLLINGLGAVIMLYWASDRAPCTKETLSDFVNLWIPVNGTQQCGIELHDIHRLFVG